MFTNFPIINNNRGITYAKCIIKIVDSYPVRNYQNAKESPTIDYTMM